MQPWITCCCQSSVQPACDSSKSSIFTTVWHTDMPTNIHTIALIPILCITIYGQQCEYLLKLQSCTSDEEVECVIENPEFEVLMEMSGSRQVPCVSSVLK